MKITTLFKSLRKSKHLLLDRFHTPLAQMALLLNGVPLQRGLHVNGLIKVFVTRRGRMNIGQDLRMNSGANFNIIGRQQKCMFRVEGLLTIGDNVGMSASAIICHHEITIGNNVIIGGNTVIYDTDFHSLDSNIRRQGKKDRGLAKWGPVRIGDDVFIGAHSTILKGVHIGQHAVIGACSVVTKDIPPDEIWAGNPAVFIRQNNQYDQ